MNYLKWFAVLITGMCGLLMLQHPLAMARTGNFAEYAKDTQYVKQLTDSAYLLIATRPDDAISLLAVAGAKAKEISYERGIVGYYSLSCEIYAKSGKPDAAVSLARKFREMSAGSSPYLQYKAAFVSGVAYSAKTEWIDSSISYYLQALAVLQQHKDLPLRSYEVDDLYANLGIKYFYQRHYKAAAGYAAYARQQYQEHNDTQGVLSCSPLLAAAYLKIGDTVSALNTASRQKRLAGHIRDSFYLFDAWDNLGGIYLAMGKIDSSMYSLRQAITLQGRMGYSMLRHESFLNLAECYFLKGDYDSAAYWLGLQRAVLDKGLGDIRIEHSYYELLARVDEKKGNMKPAEQAMRKAYDLMVRINEQAKSEQLLDHDKELTRLSAEKELLKKDQAMQKERQQMTLLSISGALLMFCFGYGFYARYRKRARQREQQIITLRHQAFFNQMKPHFIFNAILPLQTQIMGGRTTEALEYLSDFSKILRKMLTGYNASFSTIEMTNDFLESYLRIQQQAANYPFDYTITIDSAIDVHQTWTPAMVLQPVLENSIVHGLHDKENGCISVNMIREGDALRIEVKDNGSGLSSSEYIVKDHALKILEDRLDIMNRQYGVGSMQMTNRTDERGVLVVLMVPLLTYNPEEV